MQNIFQWYYNAAMMYTLSVTNVPNKYRAIQIILEM